MTTSNLNTAAVETLARLSGRGLTQRRKGEKRRWKEEVPREGAKTQREARSSTRRRGRPPNARCPVTGGRGSQLIFLRLRLCVRHGILQPLCYTE